MVNEREILSNNLTDIMNEGTAETGTSAEENPKLQDALQTEKDDQERTKDQLQKSGDEVLCIRSDTLKDEISGSDGVIKKEATEKKAQNKKINKFLKGKPKLKENLEGTAEKKEKGKNGHKDQFKQNDISRMDLRYVTELEQRIVKNTQQEIASLKKLYEGLLRLKEIDKWPIDGVMWEEFETSKDKEGNENQNDHEREYEEKSQDTEDDDFLGRDVEEEHEESDEAAHENVYDQEVYDNDEEYKVDENQNGQGQKRIGEDIEAELHHIETMEKEFGRLVKEYNGQNFISSIDSARSGQESKKIHVNSFIVMRHGERLDNNWPLWYSYFINKETNAYNPRIYGIFKTNVSMKYYLENVLPLELPHRRNMMDYELDTPLTPRGMKKAVEVGAFMRDCGTAPIAIYSSPAIRCIQTADAIATGAGMKTSHPIHVEPGLYEGSPFILPRMTYDELTDAGFNVESSYLPLMEVQNINHQEGPAEFCWRQIRVTEHILKHASKTARTENDCVLIIGHQENIGAVSHVLTNQGHLQRYAEFESTGFLFHELVTKYGSSWDRVLIPFFNQIEGEPMLKRIYDVLQDPSVPRRLGLPTDDYDKWDKATDEGEESED